ncbi:MAG: hypothetical protein IPL09_03345 [Bacteroidetes bacterium]|jgi:hypothetical protein|nr:hypothetical protein [Bacteroidota bacterium]MBK7040704.1 hypothetical protein [Bacteroidota bacterium]MBK7041752.1 hypothetical protein [Bacteroidota bacterium]MBK7588452.1 hypothetical protein [Bacteroidota bacterium]MBK8328522.1 hypothetical protein [Bacteroidota bacterium]
MAHTRCNYCGQVVNFIDIRGNSTCPVCRQSSTSCCEGGSCNISYSPSAPIDNAPSKTTQEQQPVVMNSELVESR